MDQVDHAGMLRGRVQVKDNGMHRDRNVMFTATVNGESNCKKQLDLRVRVFIWWGKDLFIPFTWVPVFSL